VENPSVTPPNFPSFNIVLLFALFLCNKKFSTTSCMQLSRRTREKIFSANQKQLRREKEMLSFLLAGREKQNQIR